MTNQIREILGLINGVIVDLGLQPYIYAAIIMALVWTAIGWWMGRKNNG